MKRQSTTTTIQYAGRTLIQPGGYFVREAVSSSLETTAQGVELVSSPFVRLEQHQNTRANRSYSFVHDFDSVEAAALFQLEAEEHAAANATGMLTITVGDTTRNYNAGLQRVDTELDLAVDAVRVTLRYSFITGAAIS